MRIEIFYFEGCPNHKPAAERVRDVIREEGVVASVTEIEIPDEAAAKKFDFLGSPTIRVNGIDIDSTARTAAGGSFACRCFPGGLPPVEMIRAALREARGQRV